MNNNFLDKNMICYGSQLRNRLKQNKILPTIGVYDSFSASLASRDFESIFCSGYGFSASFYGLPDIGLISWSHMLEWVENLRYILPESHIFVDIDDGYGDIHTTINMVKRLEHIGASAIMYEDQKRPKKCGHLEGKSVIDLKAYLKNLGKIISIKKDIFIIARTDAMDMNECLYRAQCFAKEGADAVLVEGIKNPEKIPLIREALGSKCKIVVNLIAGGKTKPITLTQLRKLGADIVFYSTPCLYSAQEGIANALSELLKNDGKLPNNPGVTLLENHCILEKNLEFATNR